MINATLHFLGVTKQYYSQEELKIILKAIFDLKPRRGFMTGGG